MNFTKRTVVLLGLLLACAVPTPVPAQTVKDDGTTLKQIIIYGRHSIRAPLKTPDELAVFAVDRYPDFDVSPADLTPHGRQAEFLLGAYFHDYLLHEGLLTGDAQADSARSYFRANSIERSHVTAEEFWRGVMQDATDPVVHSFPINPYQPDPVFDPIAAKVVTVDTGRAMTEAQGIFNNGDALMSAYSGEYSLIHDVLWDYKPMPDSQGKIDVTALPITLTANTSSDVKTGNIIDVGGLELVGGGCDPFIMQYADGLPTEKVGWGRFSLDTLSQQSRIVGLGFEIEVRSPYLCQLQSSNAGSHVLKTLKAATSGGKARGTFGDGKARLNVIISSDTYVAGLAALLHLHWQLPGYQPDFCSPGGALVFELRQSRETKKYLVRVFYTSQTLDQLRNLTAMTIDDPRYPPPATMQLMVPGGSNSSANLDVDFKTFQKLLKGAINPKYVQNPAKEVQPGVLVSGDPSLK